MADNEKNIRLHALNHAITIVMQNGFAGVADTISHARAFEAYIRGDNPPDAGNAGEVDKAT